MKKVLADGICRTLVPRAGQVGLFRGENFDESITKSVENIGSGDMDVQRCGIEFGKYVNSFESGIYTVVVTTAEGCTFVSEMFDHSLVSIHNIPSLQAFKISPNPFENDLEITIAVSEPIDFLMILQDIDGKKILEQKITVSSTFSKVLNLEKLPAAVYFLSLESEKGKAVERIVKK